MTREAAVFGISGAMFGLLVGWIIGSQQGVRPPLNTASATAQTQAAPTDQSPPPLDLQRVTALEQQAKARPADAEVRSELGNLYFDAGRFDLAIPWYEASLKLNARNVDVSTDLAVSYYYNNDAAKALKQIATSLELDPRHTKTLLNQGFIRAFGNQDWAGAQESWEKVVQYAPNSPEAARARQGLEGLRSAHAADAARSGSATGGSGGGGS